MNKEKFKNWLENDYRYSKNNKVLKSGSVAAYVSGIKSLSKKLGCKGNGIYDIIDLKELKSLKVRIIDHLHPNVTKDEKSHFIAFLKFMGTEI